MVRLGARFTPFLREQAEAWGVTQAECGRRLALIASYDFRRTDHDALARFTEHLGGRGNFAEACSILREALNDPATLGRAVERDGEARALREYIELICGPDEETEAVERRIRAAAGKELATAG